MSSGDSQNALFRREAFGGHPRLFLRTPPSTPSNSCDNLDPLEGVWVGPGVMTRHMTNAMASRMTNTIHAADLLSSGQQLFSLVSLTSRCWDDIAYALPAAPPPSSPWGAELAVTYLNEKAEPHVAPLADVLGATLLLPCDVREPTTSSYSSGQDRRVNPVRRLWPALPRQVCPSSTAIVRGGVTPDDR